MVAIMILTSEKILDIHKLMISNLGGRDGVSLPGWKQEIRLSNCRISPVQWRVRLHRKRRANNPNATKNRELPCQADEVKIWLEKSTYRLWALTFRL